MANGFKPTNLPPSFCQTVIPTTFLFDKSIWAILCQSSRGASRGHYKNNHLNFSWQDSLDLFQEPKYDFRELSFPRREKKVWPKPVPKKWNFTRPVFFLFGRFRRNPLEPNETFRHRSRLGRALKWGATNFRPNNYSDYFNLNDELLGKHPLWQFTCRKQILFHFEFQQKSSPMRP